MIRTPVSSKNIKSIGYENYLLEVEFLDGSVYHYYDVPENIYRSLMSAKSHGEFLAAHIKGRFRYKKIK